MLFLLFLLFLFLDFLFLLLRNLFLFAAAFPGIEQQLLFLPHHNTINRNCKIPTR